MCCSETGYGPSGLPHIGTFGEVVRTTMVRHAFQRLSDIPTKLFAFSDDMDGLRKVPTNVPNQEMLAKYIGIPLTKVPDPFGTHESFGHHNNARPARFPGRFRLRLRVRLLDRVLFSPAGSTRACSTSSGTTTRSRRSCWPALREERAQTYSPFLPVSQKTGKVLMTKVVKTDPDAGTIVYEGRGRQPGGDASHRRTLQAAMEAGLGECAGACSASITRCRART